MFVLIAQVPLLISIALRLPRIRTETIVVLRINITIVNDLTTITGWYFTTGLKNYLINCCGWEGDIFNKRTINMEANLISALPSKAKHFVFNVVSSLPTQICLPGFSTNRKTV